MVSKNINTLDIPSHLELSKLCLTVEAKSCNPDMIINEVEEIFEQPLKKLYRNTLMRPIDTSA